MDFMENESCEAGLRGFIKEVVAYHRICNFYHGGPIVFTIKMAAFAVPAFAADEVATCIRMLAAKGHITIQKEDPLSFSPKPDWIAHMQGIY